ncbi:RNA polymerase sigma factor [Paenibacillus sp. WLX1005]|uniref:RNA polymerase sigma factor n=1 Tax=Paenibacillus sp. WLX1005 TaxID=3243766 RepID=UPI0039845A6F
MLQQQRNKEKEYSNVESKEEPLDIGERARDIIDKYGDSLLRLSYSYMHNLMDAEDVIQETLIRYLNYCPKFENDIHEKAWLIRVTINLCKNKLKYNKRRQSDELDEGLFSSEDADLLFVWEAVKKLEPAYSEVIHLFYHEGYSTVDIANLTHRKDTTVRSLLHRARMKLKSILVEEYDFDD